MSTQADNGFPKEFDTVSVEARCRRLWDDANIYRYDPSASADVFSVDTPPPYVSAAHLHVGHAMSYSQADFVVRYHRMRGRKVFYPMGFDDNGLPTERYVEKSCGVNKATTTRRAFRDLCLEETRKGAAQYEAFWRDLALSVDWELRYSTIDDHCRRTAQKSFLDLYRRGRVYRSDEPVLWDPTMGTSLAQADLETVTRRGHLHDIRFVGEKGEQLVISTTRPELLAGCVALYCHPEDDRYRGIVGTTAVVPLFGFRVPLKADQDVSRDFGTGLMMVCTFGDGEDVRRWKRDGLEIRICIGPDGRMTEAAGSYAGMPVVDARRKVVADLKVAGLYAGSHEVEQNVSVSERSGAPVEFVTAPQWFIRVLDLKPELLRRSNELNWHPEFMKVRLDTWIDGLKYDWNISRQRFYGVPFPVWYCSACNQPVLAEEDSLPVDPLESPCPVRKCPACGGTDFRGEADVMDTWMTSSLTPLINANWAGTLGRRGSMELHPMTVRVQAFEIIRTWLFYTLVKSDLHVDSLPWKGVMVSGWGLNEQGKKISKRDLEAHTDKNGFNRYEPHSVIRKYGADAVRYWSAGSHLGHDLRYTEQDVKNGRKLVTKLWNAARFVTGVLGNFNPTADQMLFADRTPEDRWLLTELNRVIEPATAGFDDYDYAVAREVIDRFFWLTYCDDYLEIIKDRFWTPDRYHDAERTSARCTLWESLRTLLALYAPFLPYVTEEIYQLLYKKHEDFVSIHVSRWPDYLTERVTDVPEMQVLLPMLRAVREYRTANRIGQGRGLDAIIVDLAESTLEVAEDLRRMERSLGAVSRAGKVTYGPAPYPTGLDGVRIGFVVAAQPN